MTTNAVTGVGPEAPPWVFALFGPGMMAGNLLGAWAADRFGVAALIGGGGGLGLDLDQLGRGGAAAGRICGLAHRLADWARQNIVIITALQALP